MTETNNNLPSKIKHQFKLRNPNKQVITQVGDDLDLMSTNLLRLQQQLTEECEEGPSEEIKCDSDGQINEKDYHESVGYQYQQIMHNHKSPSRSQIKQQQLTTQQQNQSIEQQPLPLSWQHIKSQLHTKFEQYLLSNNFSTNYEEKINQLLDSNEGIMSIGNTIGLFEMVYYFKEILTTEVLREIQLKAFRSVVALDMRSELSADNEQKQLMNLCYAELIAICGTPQSEITTYYLHPIIQNPEKFHQSFNVLINMGVLGLSSLAKIVNEDFQSLSEKVLRELVKTDLIVSKVIVPEIYSDLLSVASSTKEKNTVLCLLSKIGEVAHSQELMQTLLELFKSSSVDKKLLISAIISTGKHEGQKILINILQQPKINQNIAIFIIKCLSIPSDVRKQIKLKIEICGYNIVDVLQMNNLFFYQGQMSDFTSEDNHQEDTLYVNSRMLMALIEKFVSEAQNGGYSFAGVTQCAKSFVLTQVISKEEKEDLPNLEIINAFVSILEKTKYSSKIKQSVISALGNISLPQNPIDIIQKLIQFLFCSDSSILSATCITLSKFDFIPSVKIVQRFRELLKHNLWKVRTSACQAIGSLLRQPIDTVLETLIKCLKDGSINRELVCQTLLRIHPVCQVLLIEILKSFKDSKIQEITLCSFNEKQILLSDNFLKVLEAIFDFSKNPKKQIRYICLGVVNSLRKLSIDEQIETNQFKAKNILPFYYNFLTDPCAQIRELALQMILSFGNYAELILIEGMTKGRVNCKIECAKGLGLRGVQNFRALLLGMRDMNQRVRHQCSLSILQNFTIDEIISEYSPKQSQRISLMYNIKDLLQSPLLIDSSSMKPFLAELMMRLSQHCANSLQTSCQGQLDEEMEREIREFRKRGEGMESTNFNEQDQEDSENIDPNATVTELSEQITMSSLKKAKSGNNKRYYFRLNETQVE